MSSKCRSADPCFLLVTSEPTELDSFMPRIIWDRPLNRTWMCYRIEYGEVRQRLERAHNHRNRRIGSGLNRRTFDLACDIEMTEVTMTISETNSGLVTVCALSRDCGSVTIRSQILIHDLVRRVFT